MNNISTTKTGRGVNKTSPRKPPVNPKVAKSTTTTERKPRKKLSPRVTSEPRHDMIAVAAYYLAEKRGFSGEKSLEDWLEAEIEISRLLDW